jgi:hypothetical protein
VKATTSADVTRKRAREVQCISLEDVMAPERAMQSGNSRNVRVPKTLTPTIVDAKVVGDIFYWVTNEDDYENGSWVGALYI